MLKGLTFQRIVVIDRGINRDRTNIMQNYIACGKINR